MTPENLMKVSPPKNSTKTRTFLFSFREFLATLKPSHRPHRASAPQVESFWPACSLRILSNFAFLPWAPWPLHVPLYVSQRSHKVWQLFLWASAALLWQIKFPQKVDFRWHLNTWKTVDDPWGVSEYSIWSAELQTEADLCQGSFKCYTFAFRHHQVLFLSSAVSFSLHMHTDPFSVFPTSLWK